MIDQALFVVVGILIGAAGVYFYQRWKADEPVRTARAAKKYVARLKNLQAGVVTDEQAAVAARVKHPVGEVRTDAANLP